MRRFTSIVGTLVAATVALVSCSSKKQDTTTNENSTNAIVCYFSATRTTEKAAQRIADITGATLYKIEPQELYSEADLDWRDSLSRSSVEMRNRDFRPALKDSVANLSEYSVVFIGYPNWWNTHPTLINTFIEANDLEGKTIVPFMTSGGSNITNSEKELKDSYPTLTFAKGLLMNNVSDEEISTWANGVINP